MGRFKPGPYLSKSKGGRWESGDPDVNRGQEGGESAKAHREGAFGRPGTKDVSVKKIPEETTAIASRSSKAEFGKNYAERPPTGEKSSYSMHEGKQRHEEHEFGGQSNRVPVGDPASYEMKVRGKGPGEQDNTTWDGTNHGAFDDSTSPGPYTRSDRQGLLNDPKTGMVSEPPGKLHDKDLSRRNPRLVKHKPAPRNEGEEVSGEWPLKQKSVAAHLRSEHQFRGK